MVFEAQEPTGEDVKTIFDVGLLILTNIERLNQEATKYLQAAAGSTNNREAQASYFRQYYVLLKGIKSRVFSILQKQEKNPTIELDGKEYNVMEVLSRNIDNYGVQIENYITQITQEEYASSFLVLVNNGSLLQEQILYLRDLTGAGVKSKEAEATEDKEYINYEKRKQLEKIIQEAIKKKGG